MASKLSRFLCRIRIHKKTYEIDGMYEVKRCLRCERQIGKPRLRGIFDTLQTRGMKGARFLPSAEAPLMRYQKPSSTTTAKAE